MGVTIDLLLRAALRGGEVACHALPGADRVVLKSGGDFATTADLAAQKAILSILENDAPGVTIIAEESTAPAKLPPTYISVDPFDGTIIGSHGASEWGILLSYIESDAVKLGVLYQPKEQILAKAERGKGCIAVHLGMGQETIVNFDALPKKRLADGIVLAFDVNYTTSVAHIERFLQPIIATGKVLVVRGLCAAVANTLELLASTVDVYVNPSGGKIWDFAPGAVAVTEAGGVAYSFQPDNFQPEPFRTDQLSMGILFAQNRELGEEILGLWGKG